jgi:hypothetical protein
MRHGGPTRVHSQASHSQAGTGEHRELERQRTAFVARAGPSWPRVGQT